MTNIPAVSEPQSSDLPQAESSFYFCVHDDLRQGEVVTISKDSMTIGASKRCDLQIHGESLAPIHCLVQRGRSGITVRRWANNTDLNDTPFDSAILRTGDRLNLGGVELELVPKSYKPPAAPLPEAPAGLSISSSPRVPAPGKGIDSQSASTAEASEIPGTKASLERLRKSNTILRGRARRLIAALRSSRRDVTFLQAQLDQLGIACRDIDDAGRQYRDLHDRIEHLEQQLVRSEESRRHLDGELAHWRDIRLEWEEQQVERNRRFDMLEQELQRLIEASVDGGPVATPASPIIAAADVPIPPVSTSPALAAGPALEPTGDRVSEPAEDKASLLDQLVAEADPSLPPASVEPVVEETPAIFADQPGVIEQEEVFEICDEAESPQETAEPTFESPDVSDTPSEPAPFEPSLPAHEEPEFPEKPETDEQSSSPLLEVDSELLGSLGRRHQPSGQKPATPEPDFSAPESSSRGLEAVVNEQSNGDDDAPSEGSANSNSLLEMLGAENADQSELQEEPADVAVTPDEVGEPECEAASLRDSVLCQIEEMKEWREEVSPSPQEGEPEEAPAVEQVEEHEAIEVDPEPAPESFLETPTAPEPQVEPSAAALTPEAAAAPQAENNSSNTSFLEKYAHLFDQSEMDDSGATSGLMSSPEPPQSQSPLMSAGLETPSAPAPAEDGEESIDDYMARLMDRVRGDGPAAEAVAVAPSQPLEQESKREPEPDPETPAEPVKPITLEEMKRDIQAAERSTDMNALRELANQSARDHIKTHAVKKTKETMFLRLAVATIGCGVGTSLMVLAEELLSMEFLGGLGLLLAAGSVAVPLIKVTLLNKQN